MHIRITMILKNRRNSLHIHDLTVSGMWWVMPITPALSEAEAGGSPQSQDYPELQGKTLLPNINKIKCI